MSAWPGGPCPKCGIEMPANVVRCRECHEILNKSLRTPPAAPTPPEYVPLPEVTVCPPAEIRGVYVSCPVCDRKLRINKRFRDKQVRCKFCEASFLLDLDQSVIEIQAYYAKCPHCREELKASEKYLGQTVECKFCSKPLKFETL
jgi:hypothetical protein